MEKKKDECLPIEVDNEVLDICTKQFDVSDKSYIIAARKEQRARETFKARVTHMGFIGIDPMNLEQSIMAMLIRHEESVMKQYNDSFRFKLPNNKDLARINENGTLEYKRGWKAGAQYMITLNKG